LFQSISTRSAALPTASVPDGAGVARGLGAAVARHAKHLRHRGYLVIHAGHAVRAQHHAHLLQHVAVVVDAGLVEADRRGDALGLEMIERRDARTQAEVRRAVMAHAGAGLGQPVDVALGKPHAVAERHVRPEHAEALDVFDRGAIAAPARVFLLERGLKQMHVHGHAVLLRCV
jgi:hypothetical protein